MICLFYNNLTGMFDSCRESDEITSVESAFNIAYGSRSDKMKEKLAGILVEDFPNFDGSKKVDTNTQLIIDNPDYIPPPPPVVEPTLQ